MEFCPPVNGVPTISQIRKKTGFELRPKAHQSERLQESVACLYILDICLHLYIRYWLCHQFGCGCLAASTSANRSPTPNCPQGHFDTRGRKYRRNKILGAMSAALDRRSLRNDWSFAQKIRFSAPQGFCIYIPPPPYIRKIRTSIIIHSSFIPKSIN